MFDSCTVKVHDISDAQAGTAVSIRGIFSEILIKVGPPKAPLLFWVSVFATWTP